MNDATPEPRRCEVCGDPLQRGNKYGICANKSKPACLLARERKRDRSPRAPGKPRHGQRHCEICGDPIRYDNRYGVCSSPKKPACAQVYHQRAWAARHEKPQQRFCEVCGDPIRHDNKMGLCRNRIECQREGRRREALRDGRTPPLEFSVWDTFGHWTVLEYYYARGGGGVLVRCDCERGTVRRVRPSRLI